MSDQPTKRESSEQPTTDDPMREARLIWQQMDHESRESKGVSYAPIHEALTAKNDRIAALEAQLAARRSMSEQTDDDLIDNAAACAQFRPLLSDDEETDEGLRECIKINVCKPLRAQVATLREVVVQTEWSDQRHTATGKVSGGRSGRACPSCYGIHPDDTHPDWTIYGHHENCPLAAALQAQDSQETIREMEKVDTLRLEAQEEEKQSSATDFDLDAHIEAVRSSPNPRPFEIPALPSQWEGITVAEAEELFANQTIDARGDNFTEHELIAVYRLAGEGGE